MKRGFTLVELLAVIIILGLLIGVVTPVVTGIISNSEEEAYNKQVDTLIKAANTWSLKNPEQLSSDKKNILQLDTLVEDGIVEDNEIINPKTNEKMEGCISITYVEEYKQYEYNYISDSSLCN